MVMCEYVFSGCARGWVVVVVGNRDCRVVIIAPFGFGCSWCCIFEYSLRYFFDFSFWYICFQFPVYAMCCINVSIWSAYVGCGRCSSRARSGSMMV